VYVFFTNALSTSHLNELWQNLCLPMARIIAHIQNLHIVTISGTICRWRNGQRRTTPEQGRTWKAALVVNGAVYFVRRQNKRHCLYFRRRWWNSYPNVNCSCVAQVGLLRVVINTWAVAV